MNRRNVGLLRSYRARALASAAVVVATLLTATPSAEAQQKTQRVPRDFSVLPITITSVTVQNGQLFANGLIGSRAFQRPLLLDTQATGQACPILDLQLGPIDLNLLGLRVETSEICLKITAFEGGGLLGDLLCAVANLLEGGTPLADVLAQLQDSGDLTRFLNGLTNLLNQAVDQIVDNNVNLQASCTILNLSLGPIELNLLGLVVELDDCHNGPVTVDITAIPGGGLLGDLLCSLSDLLGNNNASPTAIQALLWQISRLLAGLLG